MRQALWSIMHLLGAALFVMVMVARAAGSGAGPAVPGAQPAPGADLPLPYHAPDAGVPR